PPGALARLGTLRLCHSAKALAYSPDAKLLASAGAAGVRLWEAATGKEVRRLEEDIGKRDEIDAVAFSPDGKLLASTSWDLSVRIWDVATGKKVHQLKWHHVYAASLAFAPDGKTLASGESTQGTVRLWDRGTWNLLRQVSEPLQDGNAVWIR